MTPEEKFEEDIKRINHVLSIVARTLFAGLFGFLALIGLGYIVGVKEGTFVHQKECDRQIDAAVKDLCHECLCREFPEWWCSSSEEDN